MNRSTILALMLLVISAPAPAAPESEETPATMTAPEADTSFLRDENARLRLEVDQLRARATDAPLIERENQQLRERVLGLETERERLRHENQTLGSWRDGLKTGAGIFVIGLVIGLLLGRARRRSDWSEV